MSTGEIQDHSPHGVLNGTNEAKRVVGNLACQHDTYLQRLSTTVCDCQKNSLKKPSKDEAYEVQFLDTILFPEGGGQPWDHGSVVAMKDGQPTEIPVRKVLRRKLEAIHYVPTPIEVGTQVELKLDFDRRFDQAQQHSGQHLLSAVLDTLDIPTLAWSMGPELVYIEVPRLPEDLKAVERQCNKHIADNLTITVTETRERPKNLPADYDASAGVIRVVSIGGIDANPCCGTHVRSTAELNSLTILYTNPIKGANRNNHRIYFVVGGRCQKLLSEVHGNARTMGANLSCQISDLPEKITVMQNQLKELMKREKNLKSDLVQFDSQVVRAKLEKTGKAYLHKPTGDIEYLNALLAALPNPIPGICVLVAGERDGGPIVITGEETQVKELSARVKQALPAMKGGGRPQKFQGKVAAYAAKDLVFLGNLLD